MKKNHYELIYRLNKIWKSQLLKKMRIVVLLILISVTQTFALDAYAQNKRLSLNFKNETIVNILEKIEDQSEFWFMYDASKINVNQRKSVDVENKLIGNILDELFNDTEISYSIHDRQILLSITDKSDTEQQKTVSGAVTDESGQPLPGVTVLVKGTTQGTVTNNDGTYSLTNIPDNATLQFSFVGMRTQEIGVDGKTSIDVKLLEDAIGLEEVVAVGYGTQKKATLTGSIETVSDQTFKDRAVTSPALALQGQTPGLIVTRSSSRPGNEGINLQIRGESSVNGGSPLIVIDGSPVINNQTFYDMNQDDIESISILKDASAAIYGSRAANGVILVTTKIGKGKMKIDVNSTSRVNVIGIIPPSPTMQQYATVWLEAAAQDGAQANYWGWQSKDNLLQMQQGIAGIYTTQLWGDIYLANAPRFKDMYGSSLSNQQNISLSGSSEKSSYRISGGYAKDVGVLKAAYDGKVQYNAMLNYDYKVTDWLMLESSVSYFNTHVSSPSSGLDKTVIAQDPPFFPAKNPDGEWYANFGANAGASNSVAAATDGGRENTYRDQLKLNFAATLNITKDLSFKTTASISKEFFDDQ